MKNMETYKEFNDWFSEKDKPSYEGFEIDEKYTNVNKANQAGKSRYSCANSLLDNKGRPVKDPSQKLLDEPQFGPFQYVLSCGYDRKNLEGGSNAEHLKVHEDVFNRFYEINGRWPVNIAEIGFNYGVSACNFLRMLKEKNEDDKYKVVSFDLGNHSYCFYAKIYTDFKYKNKHLLVNGCSTKSVPTFSELSDTKFDIIFIDGDHTFFGAYTDVLNCKKISHENTLVILDNVVPHRGVGKEVYLAFLKAYRDQYIYYLDRFEIDIEGEDYHDGCMLIRYNFSNEKLNRNYKQYQKELDYPQIERKTFSYSINKILRDGDLSKQQYTDLYNVIVSNQKDISEFVLKQINQNYIDKYNKKFNLKLNRLNSGKSNGIALNHHKKRSSKSPKSSNHKNPSHKSPNPKSPSHKSPSHKSPNRSRKSPAREPMSSEHLLKSPMRGAKSPMRGTKRPMREVKSPMRGAKSPMRGAKSPMRGEKSQ